VAHLFAVARRSRPGAADAAGAAPLREIAKVLTAKV
jgi:hypothetical protein